MLVIKLGALGDFVLALAAMRRIDEAHPEAEITLLTTPPFAAIGRACPYVQRVEDDGRPEGLAATARLIARLRRARYDRVYDLQTSGRSSSYFQLLRPNPPEWSGIAAGCSHPHRNPDRDGMHTLERQAEQLRDAGIWPDAPTEPGAAPPPYLGWMADAPATPLGLVAPYALLVPGASPHRPEKRWPTARFAALAARLQEDGLQVAVIGGAAEAEMAAAIADACPGARDLTGKTGLLELGAVGVHAAIVVGNDTGPVHLLAAAGAPTLALFSDASDPALCRPRGRRVAVLRRPSLGELTVEEVAEAAERLLSAA